MRSHGKTIIIGLTAFLFLGACGIEDYPVIDPIPQASITQQMNDRAVVRIPNSYGNSPFSHFAVFYKIYISDIPQVSTTIGSYSTINPILATDYNSFASYIDSTTLVNTNMFSLFDGRGYKYLCIEGGQNISNILTSDVWGKSVVFEFSSGRSPTVTANSITYTLWRSDNNGISKPEPDRFFRNKDDLWKPEYIEPTVNSDVVNKPDLVAGGPRYTYAAMFITAVGVDTSLYREIYSTPSLIHVFMLPN